MRAIRSLRGDCADLMAELDQLRAEVAGLRTGYEAYEQVNAELKAENETLTKIFSDAPDLPDADVEWLEKTRALEADLDQLKAEGELMRHQLSACAKELRAASDWICREVEGGTRSATHWAVRLKTNADQIDAAMGKGEQS